MQNWNIILSLAVFLLGLSPVMALNHQFPSIHAGLFCLTWRISDSLTRMVQAHEEFIKSRRRCNYGCGFSAKGILLQAYDTQNDRVLVVITALKDVDAEHFDINEHHQYAPNIACHMAHQGLMPF